MIKARICDIFAIEDEATGEIMYLVREFEETRPVFTLRNGLWNYFGRVRFAWDRSHVLGSRLARLQMFSPE